MVKSIKNLFKSINRMAFVKPSSILRYQLSVMSIRAVRVELE